MSMLLATVFCAGAAADNFTPLGTLIPGAYSGAMDVSADGSVVVGYSSSSGDRWEAFHWTAATGMVRLVEPTGPRVSLARKVSADGSMTLGTVGEDKDESVLWKIGEPTIVLAPPLGNADDFSDGATAFIGTTYTPLGTDGEAFRWTAAEGLIRLGDLPGGDFASDPVGISGDGLVVVGDSPSENGSEAFRWTAATGMVGLGDLPGGRFASVATDACFDGSVIVGTGESANGREAFRWTATSGMVGLGDLPGGYFESYPYDVSADGSTIVGTANLLESSLIGEAFYWNESLGMTNLRDLLISRGVDNLAGWTLLSATGVSADGSTVVGVGLNPQNRREAWIATVSSIPLTGDASGDGTVDRSDAAIVAANFGISADAMWAHGDFTGDGAVGIEDLAILQAHLSPNSTSKLILADQAIPEPSTVALLTTACLCGSIRVKRIARATC